jgi:hypothetical protein
VGFHEVQGSCLGVLAAIDQIRELGVVNETALAAFVEVVLQFGKRRERVAEEPDDFRRTRIERIPR